MAKCSECGGYVECPGHHHASLFPLETPVMQCKPNCSLWARVSDNRGRPVKGMRVSDGTTAVGSKSNGFAAFEDKVPGQYQVTISLGNGQDTQYKLPAPPHQTKDGTAGAITYYKFEVRLRARPVMNPPDLVAAVGGEWQTITLTTDQEYDGKATFRCTRGFDTGLVEFNPPMVDGKIDFAAITEAGTTIQVRGLKHSALNGVELSWELDPELQVGGAAVRTMTVVEAAIQVHRKSGVALSKEEKAGDGVVVHVQNVAKERRRAKVVLDVKPAEWRGEVVLARLKENILLYPAENGGVATDLLTPLPVGPGARTEFYLEGQDVSADKADTGLTIAIKDLTPVVDSFMATVVEVKLTSYAARVGDRKAKALPIADDQKFDPGRTLIRQTVKNVVQRARLQLTKEPLRAPCSLQLAVAAGDGKIKAFPYKENARGSKESFENWRNGETAADPFPKRIAADGVPDADGLSYWVEGLALSTPKEVEVQIDIDDVDVRCDVVAYTVVNPTLEVEVVHWDGSLLQGDIDFDVTYIGETVPAKTDLVAQAVAKKRIEIDAGNYVVKLKPQHAVEKKMRVNRLVPDTDVTAVEVMGTTAVKFELAPPYKKVQFIGYWQKTGAYIGKDTACAMDTSIVNLNDRANDFKTKWTAASMPDVTGRCGVMKAAIEKAYADPHVKKTLSTADREVLKVFMAPEFYFRGAQGVYPFEAVSEILNDGALRTEMMNGKYKDWLFVLGSAIGAIEGGGRPPADYAGQLDWVFNAPAAVVVISCGLGSPAAGVAAGWYLCIEKDVGAWALYDDFLVTSATTLYDDGVDVFIQVGLAANPVFTTAQRMKVWSAGIFYDVEFTDDRKLVNVAFTPAKGTPAEGWKLEQDTVTDALLTYVWDLGGGRWGATALAPIGFAPKVDAITLHDPGGKTTVTEHNATIKSVKVWSRIFAKCPTGSAAVGVAAGWKLRVNRKIGMAPDAFESFAIREVIDCGIQSGNKLFELVVTGDMVFEEAHPLAVVRDVPPLTEDVFRREKTKTIRMVVKLAGTRPLAGWAVGGAFKGAVLRVIHLGSDKYLLDVATAVNTVANAGAIKLIEPRETEIVNIAPVFKGGTEVPVGADGRALKELLVYKETISSVDFQTMDYGGGLFYNSLRHLISAYGDELTRSLPTVGSSDTMGVGPNVAGTMTSSGQRISEVSLTGIGGGTVFTMDGITFGLEVCLDHVASRLKKYYEDMPPTSVKASTAGDPKVQIQLIPSCGASIGSTCTVKDGPVFNVDTAHVNAQMNDAGTLTAIALTGVGGYPMIPPIPDVPLYFDITGGPGQGALFIYEEKDIPPAEKVV